MVGILQTAANASNMSSNILVYKRDLEKSTVLSSGFYVQSSLNLVRSASGVLFRSNELF